MSPHKYEVVVLKPIVKTCYGCGSPFADKYRSSPYNLVVKHVDRRVTGKNDHTGQLLYSRDFANTYYHLVKSHIQRRNPVFFHLNNSRCRTVLLLVVKVVIPVFLRGLY